MHSIEHQLDHIDPREQVIELGKEIQRLKSRQKDDEILIQSLLRVNNDLEKLVLKQSNLLLNCNCHGTATTVMGSSAETLVETTTQDYLDDPYQEIPYNTFQKVVFDFTSDCS
jgi:hypothetical protein